MLLLCIFFIMSKFFEFAILQTIYFIKNFLFYCFVRTFYILGRLSPRPWSGCIFLSLAICLLTLLLWFLPCRNVLFLHGKSISIFCLESRKPFPFQEYFKNYLMVSPNVFAVTVLAMLDVARIDPTTTREIGVHYFLDGYLIVPIPFIK